MENQLSYGRPTATIPLLSTTIHQQETNQQNNNTTIDGEILLQYAMAASMNQNVIYFLPRNINGRSLAKSALNGGYTHGSFEMEQHVMNGKTKTATA